jgi:hypothetical protein
MLHHGLVMEAVSRSETSVNFYETTRRNIPEDGHLHFIYLFVVDNMKKIKRNSDIHSINTGHKHDFHMPNANSLFNRKVLTTQESSYSIGYYSICHKDFKS